MNKLFKQVGGGAFLKRIKSNRKIRKNALK